MTVAAQRPFRLNQSDIDKAFEGNQFRLVYQPKVDLAKGTVTGAEAFVRWLHPQLGLLPPGLFLDFMEAQERMQDLTQLVIEESIAAAGEWRKAGHDWAISINVAPVDLLREDFTDSLMSLAAVHRVPGEGIIVEVPERALAQEPEALVATLDDLRQAGVQVALDGGGIVPIDLGHYEPMPFTSIKVGGQAMIRLAERLGLNGAGAISARLRFAQMHGLEAVAVGAEQESTILRLRECGFTAVQGIWIQRPLPLKDLLSWDGAWARGNGALDVGVRPRPQPMNENQPIKAPIVQSQSQETATQIMARAAEAPRPAPAAPAPAAQPRPPGKAGALNLARKPNPTARPKAETLEDIVEDEEDSGPERAPIGEACKPMASLVQRRTKKAEAEPARGDANRRSSLFDTVFGE